MTSLQHFFDRLGLLTLAEGNALKEPHASHIYFVVREDARKTDAGKHCSAEDFVCMFAPINIAFEGRFWGSS